MTGSDIILEWVTLCLMHELVSRLLRRGDVV